MPASRSNVTKRACDGCKIRKIRCGGGQPCVACTNSRIRCTYIRVQQPRGPQRLRSTTKYLIEQTQRGLDAPNGRCASAPVEQAGHQGHQTERYVLNLSSHILEPFLTEQIANTDQHPCPSALRISHAHVSGLAHRQCRKPHLGTTGRYRTKGSVNLYPGNSRRSSHPGSTQARRFDYRRLAHRRRLRGRVLACP